MGKTPRNKKSAATSGSPTTFKWSRDNASVAFPPEIVKAKELLDSGAITQAEFDAIKAKALS